MLMKPHKHFAAKLALGLLLVFSASAFAEKDYPNIEIEKEPDPTRLSELFDITENVDWENEEKGIKEIRLKTLKNAAYSWGVQEGLYWRYNNIVEILERESLQLHTIFDWSKFIVDGKMLMPSVVEAERIFDQSSSSQVRTVNISYTLNEQARLVPQNPTWRDYLIRAVDKPQKPHDVIFPRTKEERAAWNHNLRRGWKTGVKQANDIFEIDLRRLQKEFEGRYRFRKLLTMGIVSLPKVSSSKYTILKTDNGKTMNLNDVVWTITRQSDFTDKDNWQPFFRTGVQ